MDPNLSAVLRKFRSFVLVWLRGTISSLQYFQYSVLALEQVNSAFLGHHCHAKTKASVWISVLLMCAFASRCMLSTVMLLAVCALEARFCQPLIPFPKGCSVLCSYGLVSQNVRCFRCLSLAAAMSAKGTSSVLSSLLCTCAVCP